MSPTNSPMDNITPSQLRRKIRKPMIEKKRRERINDSLNQLKELLLQSLNKDASTWNKMDKADILELAVQHMQQMNIEQQQKQRLLQHQQNVHQHKQLQRSQNTQDTGVNKMRTADLPLSPRSLSSSPLSQCSSRSTSPECDTFHSLSENNVSFPVSTIYRPVAYLASNRQYFESDVMNNSMWRPW